MAPLEDVLASKAAQVAVAALATDEPLVLFVGAGVSA